VNTPNKIIKKDNSLFLLLFIPYIIWQKILPQKRGIDKSLWVKKFIKKIEYSRDEIAVTAYYRENPGEEITADVASGWVRAATGKDKILDHSAEIPVRTKKNNGIECKAWLPVFILSQTIEIVLPNTIQGCKRKNLKHLNDTF